MSEKETCLAVVSRYPPIVDRAIRVVVFGGGPAWERGFKRFLCRLEEHPDIEFLAAFCQPGKQTYSAVTKDLLRRRGVLGLPLLAVEVGRAVWQIMKRPRAELRLNRGFASLSDRIHSVADIHQPQVVEAVRSLTPDLGLIYGSPILKPALFEIPTFGTLGIHHGKAPEYRGKKTTFWAMYHGEKAAAVIIQKINAGLDTGEIVKQGEVAIERRSYRSVCEDLENLGVEIYVQAIIDVKRGVATYAPQGGSRRKLCRDPKISDMLRFAWRQFARRLAAPAGKHPE